MNAIRKGNRHGDNIFFAPPECSGIRNHPHVKRRILL